MLLPYVAGSGLLIFALAAEGWRRLCQLLDDPLSVVDVRCSRVDERERRFARECEVLHEEITDYLRQVAS